MVSLNYFLPTIKYSFFSYTGLEAQKEHDRLVLFLPIDYFECNTMNFYLHGLAHLFSGMISLIFLMASSGFI